MTPRIFLDTADVEEIRWAVSTGLVDGIATNTQKVAQSGRSLERVIGDIRAFFGGPVAVQALGKTTEELCAHARRLNNIDPNLAIKIPANKAGIPALKPLISEGIRTNATLIFSPSQGLLAGLAGSPFISPFVGRANMAGMDGLDILRKIRQMFDRLGLCETCIIAASIKDVTQVVESFLAGAHSVAVPFRVFEAMCEHDMTEKGIAQFLDIQSQSLSDRL